MNYEIRNIFQGESIVKFVKSQRLCWFGQVKRMEQHMEVKQNEDSTENQRAGGRTN